MATRNDPKSLEAEINALGCTFIDNNSLEKICEELTSEMLSEEEQLFSDFFNQGACENPGC